MVATFENDFQEMISRVLISPFIELERAKAHARKPVLNAGPSPHKPKARKSRAQFSIKPNKTGYQKIAQKHFLM